QDPLAGLDEIGGHGSAHVSETDESDGRHCGKPLLVVEGQFQLANRPEVPVDNFFRDAFEPVRSPSWIAVLVDDRGANAFDEIVSSDAGESDAVILLETLLNSAE